MYTSIGILALAGFLAAPVPSADRDLVWWRDYYVAQEKGTKEHRPLAVFVGAGQGGYQKLTQEGQLSDPVKKVLGESYVCVYLDTSSPNQSDLIKSLAITKGQGLILSDRTGSLQAYHHDGPLRETELASQLQHFAEPDVEIRTTLSNATLRYSYYDGSSNIRPASYAPAMSTRSC